MSFRHAFMPNPALCGERLMDFQYGKRLPFRLALLDYLSFQSFENDAETGRGVSMYSTSETSLDASTNNITFEPLPDILAKTVGSRALRPRITCIDKDKQEAAAKLVSKYFILVLNNPEIWWHSNALWKKAENAVNKHCVRHIDFVICKCC